MFDSVSVCFSKGLGAPVGSALLGSADFIDEARYVRKRLGGGMRQSGLLAAAALVALDDRDQLTEDHRRARTLAEALTGTPGLTPLTPSTNIVLVDTDLPATDWIDALATVGVGCVPFGPYRLRFVTHRDVNDADLALAIDRIKEIAGEMRA
jgi:threonine aldolase